jgi:hypothetical protein
LKQKARSMRVFLLAFAVFAFGLAEFCAAFLQLQPWWSAEPGAPASPNDGNAEAPTSSSSSGGGGGGGDGGGDDDGGGGGGSGGGSASGANGELRAQYGRVVLLLVDALRPDMAYGASGGGMPYVRQVI